MRNNKNEIPKYKESYQAFTYAIASAYITRHVDGTFRHFQKSTDKQFRRLMENVQRESS
jgi:hypothetical protein